MHLPRGIPCCGRRQGGIGKTTVSTYLVHEEGTRKQFERVVWVALGQEPNLAQLQESVHVQLTGQAFDGQPTAEEKLEALRQAIVGKDVLLVLERLAPPLRVQMASVLPARAEYSHSASVGSR